MVYHVFYTNLVLHPMATQVPKTDALQRTSVFVF